jgi:glycosyltransferase involved in cell wall biosynthesis
MPEIVEDGTSGFIVPPNDPNALHEKVLWFSQHPDKILAMGAAARQRVLDKFTWPAVVERCLEIYAR